MYVCNVCICIPCSHRLHKSHILVVGNNHSSMMQLGKNSQVMNMWYQHPLSQLMVMMMLKAEMIQIRVKEPLSRLSSLRWLDAFVQYDL